MADAGALSRGTQFCAETAMADRDPGKKPEPKSNEDKKESPAHIADEPVADPDAADATVKSPVTETGLPVEEQVRKEWDPNKEGGLPTPLDEAVADVDPA
jgi:hypothetical protein